MKLFNKKSEVFGSPVTGEIINIEEVNDQVFSKKLMGDSIAINPCEGKVYAPLSGKLEVCFPTGHAYGLKTKGGQELLIHLGIDTVELEGVGFVSHVKQNDYVRKGDLLCEMDIDIIKKRGKETTVIVVVTSGETINLLINKNKVIQGQEIISII